MGLTCVLGQRVLDGDEILQRLGHFAAGDGQVTRVQEVPDPVVVLEEGLQGSEAELQHRSGLSVPTVQALPQTEPTRCRGGGIADRTPHRGCPWTLPRWFRPWQSIRCANPAAPEAASAGRKRISDLRSVLVGSRKATPHLPPRRVPRRLTRFGRFPQGKIIGRLFLA